MEIVVKWSLILTISRQDWCMKLKWLVVMCPINKQQFSLCAQIFCIRITWFLIPGPPAFQHATLKSWEGSGDEASQLYLGCTVSILVTQYYFYPWQLNFPVEKHLMVTSHDSRHVGTHTHIAQKSRDFASQWHEDQRSKGPFEKPAFAGHMLSLQVYFLTLYSL